jgi:hypothetical protein
MDPREWTTSADLPDVCPAEADSQAWTAAPAPQGTWAKQLVGRILLLVGRILLLAGWVLRLAGRILVGRILLLVGRIL